MEMECAIVGLKGNKLYSKRIFRIDEYTFQMALPELPSGKYWLQLQPKNRNAISLSIIIQ
jgi:hypothetical protein